MPAQVDAGTLQWKMKLEETARLLAEPRLHEGEEVRMGGCEWVLAVGASGAPTLCSSSPRSLISAD